MPAKAALKFIPQSTNINPAHNGGGACSTGADPELFFREDEVGIAAAKKVCGSCPAAAACRAYAIDNEEYGVWGGTTPQERNKARGGAAQTELRRRSLEAERLLNAGETVASVAAALGVVDRTVFRFKAARAAYYAALAAGKPAA